MEDRPATNEVATGLSDTLVDEEVAYRPVNVLAVLGLTLALVSVLALASRWLLLVPVVAAIACLAAVSQVRRDPDASSGFGLAAIGLVISSLVLGMVVVQRPVAQMLHANSSGEMAEAFVNRLSKGDLVGAYELTQPFEDRRPTAELAEIFYDVNIEAQEKLRKFASGQVAQALSDPKARSPEVLGHSDTVTTRGRRYVTGWLFRVPGNGAEPDRELQVRLQRPTANGFAAAAWRVTDAEFARVSK